MLIGISGTLCSGKTEVVRYLTFQGFQLLALCEENGFAQVNGTNRINDKVYSDVSSTNENDVTRDGTLNHEQSDLGKHADMDGVIQKNDLLGPPLKSFTDYNELDAYVTRHWRENFVISHLNKIEVLKVFQKRPFFLHVSVDAPIRLRYKRYNLKQKKSITLEEFIEKSDDLLFSAENPLIDINNQAKVKIINTSSSVQSLYVKLSDLQLLDESRLRPSWDAYFMKLAELAAQRSNCMKRRVGCVVVRGNRVVATGYNGTPRHLTNCNEGGCSRCNQGEGSGAALSTCLCLHAEENALLEAGRDRITGLNDTESSVLYCNTCPCLTCSIKIVQSGIKEVVYAQSYSMDKLSHKVMSEADIRIRQYSHPKERLFV